MLSVKKYPFRPFLFTVFFFLFHVNFGQELEKNDSISTLVMNITTATSSGESVNDSGDLIEKKKRIKSKTA